jgi:hypothetical protein
MPNALLGRLRRRAAVILGLAVRVYLDMMRLSDLTNKRFGLWRVIERAPSARGMTRWMCVCQCGEKRAVYGKALRRGQSTSCGCHRRVLSKERATIHGLAGSSEYWTWSRMKNRCLNHKDKDWPNYGGRGITVCGRWLYFQAFIADMGSRPSRLHSLERIDVNRGYGPENCRWATPKQQANNKRNNRRISFAGKTLNLREWAKITGLSDDVIYVRLDVLHWPIGKALTTPVHRHSRRGAWPLRPTVCNEPRQLEFEWKI